MKKHPHINAEAFHASLLSSARAYAKKVAPPGKQVTALILEPTGIDVQMDVDGDGDPYEKLMETIWSLGDEGITYKCHGSFSLPPDSASVAFMMARCTLVSPLPMTGIEGYDGLEDLPFETFSLGELLSAGHPRNTRSGIIKGTIGPSFIDGYEPDDDVDGMAQEVSMHRRFSGICTIIMDEARKAIGELLDDDEVVNASLEKELIVCLIQN